MAAPVNCAPGSWTLLGASPLVLQFSDARTVQLEAASSPPSNSTTSLGVPMSVLNGNLPATYTAAGKSFYAMPHSTTDTIAVHILG